MWAVMRSVKENCWGVMDREAVIMNSKIIELHMKSKRYRSRLLLPHCAVEYVYAPKPLDSC